ncbi:Serine/threonine protein kinase [Sterolibacterium denitrificans]|uniref:Serine/threonine protein kinase n=1 Tax=Sterolibacterium denitrificans TaxID=157592 RepID=A0A7Z7HPQ3_9PROT|nr:serine/threonine-protein kinase [Sterolibacterium denitrificans]SMB22875.1 Serine/threonine protein kinase [Sterolibacterium denitrificans]
MSQQPIQPLPPGFQLDGYRIERQLAHGGFSIVYLARDANDAPVAIKEYLPARLATRTGDSPVPIIAEENLASFRRGMKSFFEEGRVLAGLDHPNVVRVLNFFRANETAYLVMRYERGRTLQEHIQRHPGTLGETFIRNVFTRLLNGLREIHMRKLLHLDIKPANIYLRMDGHPVLLDFGATRQGLGDNDQALGSVHTPGYAAPEQTSGGSGEAQGPWTDIYAVGATLYACLAGSTPLSAEQRAKGEVLEPAQQRWRKAYTLQLLELIDWCMRLPVAERPQSVFALQKVLNGELLDLVDPAWFDTSPPSTWQAGKDET